MVKRGARRYDRRMIAGSTTDDLNPPRVPKLSAPFRWLRLGAEDLRARPWPSLFYAISAMLISLSITFRYFGVMMLWAALIVCLIVLGLATAFAGLIVTGPWVGLASWHAYRELVSGVDRTEAQ